MNRLEIACDTGLSAVAAMSPEEVAALTAAQQQYTADEAARTARRDAAMAAVQGRATTDPDFAALAYLLGIGATP